MWHESCFKMDDLNDVIEMTKEYYGDIEISNKKFVNHEYFENPSGDAVIRLARDNEDDTLAGQYVVNPARFRIESEDIPAVLSLNTLTRDKYRGQGIFTGLAELVYSDSAERGYNFCYSMPNQNSYPGFIKKLNFADIGNVPLWLRPIKPSTIVAEKIKSHAMSTLAKPANVLFRPRKKKSLYEIQKINSNNLNLIDELWEEIKDKYKIWVIRDSKFFRWRYIDMPIRKYHIYTVVSNGKPVAVIVGRMTNVADMTCGMVVDFFYAEGHGDEAKHLLDFMLYNFYKNGAGLCGCLMKNNVEEAKILKSRGFFVCPEKLEPQPFRAILRVFNDDLKNRGLEKFDNWFFTMGDYDVI
ncbi:MAG: GNAT family N-acetyltransferase [Firmicutes bacterium]|nr:GNAT family N-acetyltransferase [Bacillota bacterium]